MDLRVVRLAFVLGTGLVTSQLFGLDYGWPAWIRGLIGMGVASALVMMESLIHKAARVSVRGLSVTVFGLLLGLIMAKLAADTIGLVTRDEVVLDTIHVALTWGFCYICAVAALRGQDEFNLIIPYVRLTRKDRGEESYLVDTSAIIDGRLLDLCRTRFIEGRLLIPRFVLKELQAVADSSDSIKRSRGRRGLDILNQLRQQSNVDVRIRDEDIPQIDDVDAKLVKLAQILGARIITNDFNLNKVAEFQEVGVLNVNDLAQALRPVVLPGEVLDIKPIKDGKEPNQAIGYLDDGTMVVVENGRALIGKQVHGVVTSVLQTSAGRMIFVKPAGNGNAEAMG